jgi:hypothetical protein
MAQLPEEALYSEVLRGLHYELDLPEDDRRRAVLERLRAWLQIENPAARRVAAAYDRAVSSLLDEEARAEIERSEEDAAMDGLNFTEFKDLARIMPSMARLEQKLPRESDETAFFASLAAAMALGRSDLERAG